MVRVQVMAAAAVVLRRPWAPRVIEEAAGQAARLLAYIESMLAILHAGGFTLELAHHVMHVMGCRLFGFTQDLLEDSAPGRQPRPRVAAGAIAPHLPERRGAGDVGRATRACSATATTTSSSRSAST